MWPTTSLCSGVILLCMSLLSFNVILFGQGYLDERSKLCLEIRYRCLHGWSTQSITCRHAYIHALMLLVFLMYFLRMHKGNCWVIQRISLLNVNWAAEVHIIAGVFKRYHHPTLPTPTGLTSPLPIIILKTITTTLRYKLIIGANFWGWSVEKVT